MLVQAEFTKDPPAATDLVRVSSWKQTDDAGQAVRDLSEEGALISSPGSVYHLVFTGSTSSHTCYSFVTYLAHAQLHGGVALIWHDARGYHVSYQSLRHKSILFADRKLQF